MQVPYCHNCSRYRANASTSFTLVPLIWSENHSNEVVKHGLHRLHGLRNDTYVEALYPPIAVAFLTRNSENYLADNLIFMHRELLSRCVDWRVYYVENDSTDRTGEILVNFAREHADKVHGEHLTLSSKHSTDLCPKRELNCLARLELLGSLRNRLVQAALSWKKVELLAMVDIDFYRFDPVVFWKMYTDVLVPLRADGVFGLSKFSPAVGKSCKSQPFGCEVYDYGSIIPQSMLHRVTQTRNKTSTVFHVRSAFSGLGLYNAESIRKRGAEYWKGNYSEELDSIGDDGLNRRSWGLIEHISFNFFFPRLYLYTEFQPEYGGT